MVHVFTYIIINVFPSIIVFLCRYLRSDDNVLFIYCHITIKVGKKLPNIYGRSFSIIIARIYMFSTPLVHRITG